MLTTILVIKFVLLLLFNLGVLITVHPGSVVGCHDAEREALLKFKRSVTDVFHGLSSWEGKDCCQWEQVGCNNVTGFVNRLDLHNPFNDYDYRLFLIAPKLDHSLLELRYLNYLDLSCNDFNGSQIPSFIGSFKYLSHLNLSYSNFGGINIVPSQLGNLTRLQNLDLSMLQHYEMRSSFSGLVAWNTVYSGYDLSTDLHWASALVRLQYLDMSGIHISLSRNSMHVLSKLPSLLGLRLSGCTLGNPQFYSLFSNLTSLSKIQQLDLSHNALEGPFPLVISNMTSLGYLDLSWNNLNGSIPLSIRNIRKLEHLDLSSNKLNGQIPLSNMSKLEHLDLSSNNLNGQIPLSMRNMSKLEHLDLYGNTFSSIEGILGNLCKLKYLDASYNTMGESIGANRNFTKCVTYNLEVLDLGDNLFSTLPSWILDFKYLRCLYINGNKIDGHFPASITSLTYLEELDLSDNSIRGSLPHGLGNLTKLSMLSVKNNSISGEIPTSIGNWSLLEDIDLSDNALSGTIPVGLGQCKALAEIDFSSNFLHGTVSEFHLANLSSLSSIDLSYNPLDLNFSSNWSPPFQLSGLYMKSCEVQTQFPQWIGEQSKLNLLDISDNSISGDLVQWFSSTELEFINISHNYITGVVPYFSSSCLYQIDLSYNLLSGPLIHDDYNPTKNDIVGNSICQLPKLQFIDLQRNKFDGTIPDCWGNSGNLQYINLSSNNLSGSIPMSMGLIPFLEHLRLSNNSLQGSIPSTFDTGISITILDFGENKLVGNIPITWNSETFPVLKILRLRGNQLVGAIPPALCTLPNLQFIDLAHNLLTGRIPRCFGHLIHMKVLSKKYDSHTSYYKYLYRRGDITTVVLKGIELQYTTTLEYVVNLDLSCNALVGYIPEEMTNLSVLIGLNLSHNHLTGNIPNKIGEMKSLISLDLSNNNLNGTIPSSISALTFLSNLNLSYNNLHGQIPTGHELQVIQDPSMAYIGNPGLCGDPLPNKCNPSHAESPPTQEQEEPVKEDNWEKPLLYFVIFSGFGTGFWAVVGSLLLKRRFRFALFHLMDRIRDYFYVQAMIRINRTRN